MGIGSKKLGITKGNCYWNKEDERGKDTKIMYHLTDKHSFYLAGSLIYFDPLGRNYNAYRFSNAGNNQSITGFYRFIQNTPKYRACLNEGILMSALCKENVPPFACKQTL